MEPTTIAHPDAAPELAHLVETLQCIAEETMLASADTKAMADDVRVKRIEFGALTSEFAVAEMLYANKARSLHHLQLAASRPYFTRVDFIPDEEKDERTYYIGKWGVIRSSTLDQVVVDWRAPVANLYYAGQIGRMRYTAPDGEIAGELTLKRQLGVENGTLRSIFDTDIVSQDAYLQDVLGAVSTDRLREVVSTIQAEQNYVIRHKPDKPLIVQGVAGSGKTTIALHRIAYLLYACQQIMQPKHMMIIAPNPLFLDYISAVLPDLGVDEVIQTTFPLLMRQLLGTQLPRVHAAARLEEMLALPQPERAWRTRVLRFQGSLRFRMLLLAFMDWLEPRIVPKGDVMFGPVRLYTYEQMQHIFQVELKPFPLKRRIAEIPKYLKKKLQAAHAQIVAWLEEETERRANHLLATAPDGDARRARMVQLYKSRDERLKEAGERMKTFGKTYLATWPKLNLAEVYAEFLQGEWGPELAEDERPLWDALRAESLALLAHKRIMPEDMAPMATLCLRLQEIKRADIRHTVVDEAQDFSPFQFMLLRELTGNDSFTIVGDLMQGIHAYTGLATWDEITVPVFESRANVHHLQTSYRNTIEIMQFASRVPKRHPVPGQMLAKPVLRHGQAPTVHAFATEKVRNAFLAEQIAAFQREGYHSIAIVDKSDAACRALHKALPAALEARLLQASDAHYAGGVLVLPATLVKGLEFDVVMMADVSAARFADEPLDARLLYVCLTRPLHRLVCCAVGAPTALMEGMG